MSRPLICMRAASEWVYNAAHMTRLISARMLSIKPRAQSVKQAELQRWLAVVLTALGANIPLAVMAEKADRLKPMVIEANKAEMNDLNQTSIYSGRVVLSKGSLVLRCDSLQVNQSADGFQQGICIGKPAQFRQRRDVPGQSIEGQASRIEYDSKSEVAKFLEQAQVRRLDQGKLADEVQGTIITYNGLTELYSVDGREDQRVRIVIQPKSPAPGAGAGSVVSSKANEGLKQAEHLQKPPR
jgi:lipopolysaccharide export system protein LptA